MPQPTPSDAHRRDRPLTRRTALVGVAAATVVVTGGCTSDDADHRAASAPRPSSSPSVSRPPANPDVALAARVLAAEREMLARVTATARKHRRLAPVLAGARTAHAAHVRLLARAVPAHTSASASPAPSARPKVPAGRVAALRAVAGAETALGARHARDAVAASSGAFARVVASLAAASAQQAAHLAASTAARPGS